MKPLIQTPKKKLVLKQPLGTSKYIIHIPSKVEKIIRHLCAKFPTKEWSGVLFTTHKGSFKEDNIEVFCEDIFLMDIGNATYTEFDMSPDVASYMVEHPELLDCQMSLIHSHDTMATFFSGTDTSTLLEEGSEKNNFVSLIVNNAGEYTAAITRKNSYHRMIVEKSDYTDFENNVKTQSNSYEETEEVVEYFYLQIDKEEVEMSELEARINEIQSSKTKVTSPKVFGTKGSPFGYNNSYYNCGWDYDDDAEKLKQEGYAGTLFSQQKEEVKSSDKGDYISNIMDENGELLYHINPNIISTCVKQLVTCSLVVPNESKIDVEKWATNLPRLFDLKYGGSISGLCTFEYWADSYTEFITWNINDKELISKGLDSPDIQAIAAFDLIAALQDLPQNEYIEVYIKELEKYLI